MTIEKLGGFDQEGKLPSIYDSSLKVLTDGGLENDEARELILMCVERFQSEGITNLLNQAFIEYLNQNPVKDRRLDDDDIELIYEKLAEIIQGKLRGEPGKEPKLIYTSPGGIKITESSKN
jgi:hypothetical protein